MAPTMISPLPPSVSLSSSSSLAPHFSLLLPSFCLSDTFNLPSVSLASNEKETVDAGVGGMVKNKESKDKHTKPLTQIRSFAWDPFRHEMKRGPKPLAFLVASPYLKLLPLQNISSFPHIPILPHVIFKNKKSKYIKVRTLGGMSLREYFLMFF